MITGSAWLGVVVHDRVHGRLAVHGMAGGSLQSQAPALRRRRPLEPGDGRDGVLGRFLPHVLLAGSSGHRRGELRRDRADACSPTSSRSRSGAGQWGSTTWRCRSGRRWDTCWAATIADALGWRAVFFVVGLPGLLAALAGPGHERPGRGCIGGGSYAGKAEPARPERISRTVPDADISSSTPRAWRR